jgi:hypothetical protein
LAASNFILSILFFQTNRKMSDQRNDEYVAVLARRNLSKQENMHKSNAKVKQSYSREEQLDSDWQDGQYLQQRPQVRETTRKNVNFRREQMNSFQ